MPTALPFVTAEIPPTRDENREGAPVCLASSQTRAAVSPAAHLPRLRRGGGGRREQAADGPCARLFPGESLMDGARLRRTLIFVATPLARSQSGNGAGKKYFATSNVRTLFSEARDKVCATMQISILH